MNTRKALEECEGFVAEQGLAVKELTASQGVAVMVAFYRDRPSDDEGDDLLYEYGTYDWGSGEFFELSIVRQFLPDDSAEDEDVWQLSLTLKYDPTDELRLLDSGESWCGTHAPRGVDHFAQTIEESAAFRAVADLKPDEVELYCECAG